MGDELIEVENASAMTREEAAAELHRLADALARQNEVEMPLGAMQMTVKVPDRVTYEVEVEVGDESEIEITISW